MDVTEWRSKIPIETVLIECLVAVVPQIDENYVDRYENLRPLPVLRVEASMLMDINYLGKLPRATRLSIVAAFRGGSLP